MSELNLHRTDAEPVGLGGARGPQTAPKIKIGTHPADELSANVDLEQLAVIKKASLAERQVQMGTELENRARWAVVKGNLRELNQVLALGANPAKPDESGDTLLHLAARIGVGKVGSDVVAVLLERGVPVDAPNGHGRSALHEAAEAGRMNIVKQLIQAGANTKLPDARGLTAQDLAEMNDHSSIVKCLSSAKG